MIVSDSLCVNQGIGVAMSRVSHGVWLCVDGGVLRWIDHDGGGGVNFCSIETRVS